MRQARTQAWKRERMPNDKTDWSPLTRRKNEAGKRHRKKAAAKTHAGARTIKLGQGG